MLPTEAKAVDAFAAAGPPGHQLRSPQLDLFADVGRVMTTVICEACCRTTGGTGTGADDPAARSCPSCRPRPAVLADTLADTADRFRQLGDLATAALVLGAAVYPPAPRRCQESIDPVACRDREIDRVAPGWRVELVQGAPSVRSRAAPGRPGRRRTRSHRQALWWRSTVEWPARRRCMPRVAGGQRRDPPSIASARYLGRPARRRLTRGARAMRDSRPPGACPPRVPSPTMYVPASPTHRVQRRRHRTDHQEKMAAPARSPPGATSANTSRQETGAGAAGATIGTPRPRRRPTRR